MLLFVSKVLTWLLRPSSIVTLLLLFGLAALLTGRWPGASRRLLSSGVGLMVAFGLSPLGNILVLPLEGRFQRPELPATVSGIIMLGGFESPGLSRARGQLAINESAERLTESLVLAHLRPDARLIFTGGSASLGGDGHGDSAAESVGGFLRAVGIAPARIVLEERSRTTYENALFLREKLAPRPGERYVLVTSAFHMPRSVATFRRQGFDVVPWPVDYRTHGAADAFGWFGSIQGGLERMDFAAKEWAGLIAYRIMGRTAELWPGPM